MAATLRLRPWWRRSGPARPAPRGIPCAPARRPDRTANDAPGGWRETGIVQVRQVACGCGGTRYCLSRNVQPDTRWPGSQGANRPEASALRGLGLAINGSVRGQAVFIDHVTPHWYSPTRVQDGGH